MLRLYKEDVAAAARLFSQALAHCALADCVEGSELFPGSIPVAMQECVEHTACLSLHHRTVNAQPGHQISANQGRP